MSKIQIVSNGFKLSGNLFRASGPQKLAFLFLHGWMGHQNVQAAQRLADMGFTCMTYDMRGHNESEGELAGISRADFLDDAVHVYDYFKQQLDEETKIGVIGSSFGCYIGALLSEKRAVDCLALRVPAGYPEEGFDEPHLPRAGSQEVYTWRTRQLNFTENHALKAMHAFSGPVLIIEAENDELVPHQTPLNYANAVANKHTLQYVVMKGAPHSLVTPALHAEYTAILSGWVQSLEL